VVQLTTNFSTALVDLIHAGEAPIDAIEVGPYFSTEQIQQYQKQLPGWTFQLHVGHLFKQGSIAQTVQAWQAYARCTQTSWASFHLVLIPQMLYHLASRFGIFLPSPNPDRATQRFIRDVVELKRTLPVPILLENMASVPNRKGRYTFQIEPRRITKILDASGARLLLDLGHARVAAATLKLDVHDYLQQMPLDRVDQIHVSGVRPRDGLLYDAHESLEEIDYALLDWVLERTQSQVLTLEYFRQREPLREQLQKLRTQLDGN
jgi:uncharacterized protein (UPF0276 family)